jgi:hypothetical protein
MKRKERFLNAVRILAPDDAIILQAARHVPEDSLPRVPGGVALEFVVAMQRASASPMPCRSRFKYPHGRSSRSGVHKGSQTPTGLEDSLRVKSAEFWLKLGQPLQALIEIQNLPDALRNRPPVLQVHLAAIAAIRESAEQAGA